MNSASAAQPRKLRVQKQTVKSLTDKIAMFAQAMAKRRWFPYQEEFARRVIESVILNDGEEITALFSRQSGKSTTISDVVGGLMVLLPDLQKLPMYQHVLPDCMFKVNKMTGEREYRFREGVWIGIFAPSLEQSESTFEKCKYALTNDTAKELLNHPELRITFDTANGDTIKLNNGSIIRCQTASPNANIESKTYHIVLVEEAQDVETFKVRKSIHPMLASTNGSIVKIGTPNNKKSDFYEALQRNRRRAKLPGEARNHFEFDYKYCAKYNDEYAKYVEGEKRKIGEKSDEFRMAYKLEWIMERGMFISREMLCGTIDNRWGGLGQNYAPVDFTKRGRHVAGIDVAKSPDSTIVTILEVDYDHPEVIEEKVVGTGEVVSFKAFPKKVIAWMEIEGEDYETQYHMVVDFLNGFNIEKIVIDSTNGNGETLKDRLAIHYDQIEVEGYTFTTPSKSALYKNLNTEIHGQRIIFPWSIETEEECIEAKKFVHQMENLERTWKGQHIVVSHPEGKDEHDDYPDSLALACWAAREDYEEFGKLQETENTFYGRGSGRAKVKRSGRFR